MTDDAPKFGEPHTFTFGPDWIGYTYFSMNMTTGKTTLHYDHDAYVADKAYIEKVWTADTNTNLSLIDILEGMPSTASPPGISRFTEASISDAGHRDRDDC